MALPEEVNLIPVHIDIIKTDGTPASGTVTFQIPEALRTAYQIVGNGIISATLEDGEADVELPSVDDPDVAPQGWAYIARVNTDAWKKKLTVVVPGSPAGTLQFSAMLPLPENPVPQPLYLPVLGGQVSGDLGISGQLTVAGGIDGLTAEDVGLGNVQNVASAPAGPGKNLFDYTTADAGLFWNGVGGTPIVLAGWYASKPIPVTAGQQYSLTNARNYEWLNASLTAPVGTYGNNPTEAPVNGVTAPVGAAYLAFNVSTAKRTTAQVEVGPVATTFEAFGYVVQRQIVGGSLLSDQIAQVGSLSRLPGLNVFRDGTKMLVRTPWDSDQDILLPWDLAGGSNAMVQPANTLAFVSLMPATDPDVLVWPTFQAGTGIHGTGDDNCPINTHWSYVGGNHGWAAGTQVTANGHGKTTADLGSRWSDGTRTYTLIQVIDANRLMFAGPYTVASSVVTGVITVPAAPLTHVAGATNTATVPIAGGVLGSQQIFPAVFGQTVKVELDGKAVPDGKNSGQVLVITETYYVVSYKGMVDTAQANIGVPLTTYISQAPAFARISNTYRVSSGGLVVVAQKVTAVEKQQTSVGVTQAYGISMPAGGSLRQFMAGIGTVGPLNFSTLADLSGMGSNLDVVPGSYLSPTVPAVSAQQWAYNSSGVAQYGLALGILPVGDGHPAQRLKNATTKTWFMSNSTKKNYPQVVWNKAMNPGDTVSGTAYRRYLSPEHPEGFTVTDGTDTWVVIERTTTTTEGRVTAPQLLGRRLVPVTPPSLTVAGSVTGEGIAYVAPSSPGYGMWRAAPELPRRENLPGATRQPGSYFLMHQGPVGTQVLTGSFQILYLFPMELSEATWVDRAAMEITAIGTGVLRHGVYAHDPATGLPVATGPIADFGTIDVTSTGAKESTLASPALLPEGWHWYGLVWQGTNTTAPTFRCMTSASGSGPLNVGGSLLALMSNARNGYFVSGVTGALGALAISAATAHTLTAPRIGYRAV